MAEQRIRTYEGLFLLNHQAAAADFSGTVGFVREVFNRAQAEVLVLRKWDERKLAYEIKGQKRGVYILAYFKARPTQIANIERDCNLSDQVLRCLIIKGDHLGEAEIAVAKEGADLSLEAKLRTDTPPAAAPGSPTAAASPAAAPVAAAVADPDADDADGTQA